MSFRIVNPEELGAPKGWNNGLVAEAGGRVLFVAGQIASDADGQVVTDDFVGQFERALANAVAVVEAAGGGPEHVGRLTIYVTRMEAYRSAGRSLGEAYRRVMGRHYPAMALMAVTELVNPEAVVEIEATAVLPPEA